MSADDGRMSLSISLSVSTISFRFRGSDNRYAGIRSDFIDLLVVQPQNHSTLEDIQRSTLPHSPQATRITLGQVQPPRPLGNLLNVALNILFTQHTILFFVSLVESTTWEDIKDNLFAKL